MGDGVEVPETAVFVEAAMLEDVWALDNELVLEDGL